MLGYRVGTAGTLMDKLLPQVEINPLERDLNQMHAVDSLCLDLLGSVLIHF